MKDKAPPFNIRPEALPLAIRELAQAIGDSDALRLIGMHGGARVKVPRTVDFNDPLHVGLSTAGYERLIKYYGGDSFDVPKGDAYLRELRHEQVRQCREQGMTVNETAEATGYTRRHVMNITGGDGVDTHTIDMFADLDEEPELVGRQLADPFGRTGRKPRAVR
ncbi:MAG TPA: hypothetical protein VF555_16445 [Variovorax sp.]